MNDTERAVIAQLTRIADSLDALTGPASRGIAAKELPLLVAAIYELTQRSERIADKLADLAMDRGELRELIDDGETDEIPVVVLTAYSS